MKPYYEHAGVAIYHGDAREVLPSQPSDSIITDPVWPDCERIFPGIDARKLLAETLRDAQATRIAIQLGCYSDPRILNAVPTRWKFFRVCDLELARPSYRGRLLMTGDTGYLFGDPPPSRPGFHIIGGRTTDTSGRGREADHPCPRKLSHLEWLVSRWSAPNDVIVDPFCGSGTTLVAAKNQGRKVIGIEVEEMHCEVAAKRLSQEVFSYDEVPT